MCSRWNFAIFAAAVIFCSLSHQIAAQDELKYIVAITEYSDEVALVNSTRRCYATFITDRHVVTTADCVKVSGSTKLAVAVEGSIQTSTLTSFGRSQCEKIDNI